MTIKSLLQKLNLLGDCPLQEQYREFIARRVALNRVLQQLQADRLLYHLYF